MKNLLVTGYRAHELQIFNEKHKALPYIKKAFLKKVIPLIEDGLEWIITPGQYGFDLWASEVAIKLRNEVYSHLKISMITAFANQGQGWNETKQQYYEGIKNQLDHYAEVSKQSYVGPWQFQARDRLLLNKTDGILLFYDEEAAPSQVKYIKEKAILKYENEAYQVITMGADDIQTIMEDEQPMDEYA